MGTGRRIAIVLAAATLMLWQAMPAAWASGGEHGGDKQHQQQPDQQHGQQPGDDNGQKHADGDAGHHDKQQDEHHDGQQPDCAPPTTPADPAAPAAGTPATPAPASPATPDPGTPATPDPGTPATPDPGTPADPAHGACGTESQAHGQHDANGAPAPATDPAAGATAAANGTATVAQRIAKVKTESRNHAKAERAKGVTGAYLVYVDGQRQNVTPVERKGRTLVPFRRLAESLGAQVSWDQSTRTVTMVKGDQTVTITIGSLSTTINGQPVTIEVSPELTEGSTFVPLRFIAAALGADVDYDPATGAITVITTPPAPTPAPTPAPATP